MANLGVQNGSLQLNGLAVANLTYRSKYGTPGSTTYEKLNINAPVRVRSDYGIETVAIRPTDSATSLKVNDLRFQHFTGQTLKPTLLDNSSGSVVVCGTNAAGTSFGVVDISAGSVFIKSRTNVSGGEAHAYNPVNDTVDDVVVSFANAAISAFRDISVASAHTIYCDTLAGTTTNNELTLGNLNIASDSIIGSTDLVLGNNTNDDMLTLQGNVMTLKAGAQFQTKYLQATSQPLVLNTTGTNADGFLFYMDDGIIKKNGGTDLILKSSSGNNTITISPTSIDLSASGGVIIHNQLIKSLGDSLTIDLSGTTGQQIRFYADSSAVFGIDISDQDATAEYHLKFNNVCFCDNRLTSEMHLQSPYPHWSLTTTVDSSDAEVENVVLTQDASNGPLTTILGTTFTNNVRAIADNADLSLNVNWKVGSVNTLKSVSKQFTFSDMSNAGLYVDVSSATKFIAPTSSAIELRANTINPVSGTSLAIDGLTIGNATGSEIVLTGISTNAIHIGDTTPLIVGANLQVDTIKPYVSSAGVTIDTSVMGGASLTILTQDTLDDTLNLFTGNRDGFKFVDQNDATLVSMMADTFAITATTTTISNDATIGGNLTITGDLTIQGDATRFNVADMTVEDATIQVAKPASGTVTESFVASGAGFFLETTESALLSGTYNNTDIYPDITFNESTDHHIFYKSDDSHNPNLGRFHTTNQFVIGGDNAPRSLKGVDEDDEDNFVSQHSVLYVDEIRSYQRTNVLFPLGFTSSAGGNDTISVKFDLTAINSEPGTYVFLKNTQSSSTLNADLITLLPYYCVAERISMVTANHTIETLDQLFDYKLVTYNFVTGATTLVAASDGDLEPPVITDGLTVNAPGTTPFTNALHRAPSTLYTGSTVNRLMADDADKFGDESGTIGFAFAISRKVASGSVADLDGDMPRVSGEILLRRIVN